MLQINVLSKNRAAQLDLFLRSLHKHFKEVGDAIINVIYTTTTDDYHQGYDIVWRTFKRVNFIRENNFKDDLVNCQREDVDLTTFFCDDDIIKGEFSVEDPEWETLKLTATDVCCLALRLGKNITTNYEVGDIKQPPEIANYPRPILFRWPGHAVDWGYPMSVSGGHIYKTDKILPLLKALDYDKAWNLECALDKNRLQDRYMSCYDKSKVMQNAINIVQTGFRNKAGSYSVELLNEKFLKGFRLSLEPFESLINSSVHEIHEDKIKFERGAS